MRKSTLFGNICIMCIKMNAISLVCSLNEKNSLFSNGIELFICYCEKGVERL